jgi:hypothetical protein
MLSKLSLITVGPRPDIKAREFTLKGRSFLQPQIGMHRTPDPGRIVTKITQDGGRSKGGRKTWAAEPSADRVREFSRHRLLQAADERLMGTL